MKRLFAIGLALLAGSAHAQTFQCQAGTHSWQNGRIVVVAAIDESGNTGTIQVAGVTHETRYGVDDFDRRWDFQLNNEGTYDFAFKIGPDGGAKYYDFTLASPDGSAKPAQFFHCLLKPSP